MKIVLSDDPQKLKVFLDDGRDITDEMNIKHVSMVILPNKPTTISFDCLVRNGEINGITVDKT